MKATNINWDTTDEYGEHLGVKAGLPTEVELPEDFVIEHETSVADYLSDKYGWLVNSLDVLN